MKNKKKRPNKFRIRLFIIFWIALVIPCMLISYILYQNSQEKSKQSMAEDIQHTLTENMASVCCFQKPMYLFCRIHRKNLSIMLY